MRYAMLDNGSIIELISPELTRDYGAERIKLTTPFNVKLAKDRYYVITEYVITYTRCRGRENILLFDGLCPRLGTNLRCSCVAMLVL